MSTETHQHDAHAPAGTTPATAIDPVCGMTVDRAKAVTLEDGGRTVYFCSEHCRHAYAAEREPAHAH